MEREEEAPRARWRLSPLVWKAAVVLYLVYLFGLAAAYLGVASQQIDYSITVSGDERVCLGEPGALRVGITSHATGRFVLRAPVEVKLRQGTQSQRLYTGYTSPAGFADVNLAVPDDFKPGRAAWDLVFALEDGAVQTSSAAITLARCSARVLSTGETKEVEVKEEGSGPLLIRPVAEGGVLVDGLRSTLFLQVTDRATGEPVRASVGIELRKGMVEGKVAPSVETDMGGLAVVQLTPVGNQKWRFTVERDGVISTRELVLQSKATQHVIGLQSPVWRGDRHLRVSVRSLRRSGAMYGDFFGPAGNWSHGAVSGLGESGGGFAIPPGAVELPSEGVAVAHMQVAADPLFPGEAGDTRFVVLSTHRTSDLDVLRHLLHHASTHSDQPQQARALARSAWLVDASASALKRHIAYWLSVYPRDFQQVGVLMDSLEGQEDEMASGKDEARHTITWLLGISGALGLLVVFWMVLGNLIKVRRAGRDVAMELDLEMNGLHRAQAVVEFVFLFATLVAFFGSILALLRLL